MAGLIEADRRERKSNRVAPFPKYELAGTVHFCAVIVVLINKGKKTS